jgi:hypothetical protein
MGLTAEVELGLKDAGLIKFFDDHRAAFKALAAKAYAFAYDYVHATGLPLRIDDVATSLTAALVPNESLRAFLAAKKLRQQFWYGRFADLILDRLWKELSDEDAAERIA